MARPFLGAGFGAQVAPGAGGGGQVGQHAGQHGEGGRLEAERRRVGGQGVAVLGPAHRAAVVGVDGEQPDLPHALEVGADGVGVQAQRLGHLGRGAGRGGPGQLQVDGVPGVVAQRLQDVQPAHLLPRVRYYRRSPVKSRRAPAAHLRRRHGHPPGGGRPRAGRRHRRARHGQRRGGERRRLGRGHRRPDHLRLPAAGPDPRRRAVEGQRPAGRRRRQGPLRRDEPGAAQRGHAAGAEVGGQPGAGHRGAPDRPGAGRRQRQGRRGQELRHRQPGLGPGRPGLQRGRARRRHLGLQRAADARDQRPAGRRRRRASSAPTRSRWATAG